MIWWINIIKRNAARLPRRNASQAADLLPPGALPPRHFPRQRRISHLLAHCWPEEEGIGAVGQLFIRRGAGSEGAVREG